MGLAKLKTKISAADYLKSEKNSQIKHEFIAGEIYSLAGMSEKHHRISLNLAILLDAHLENSECDVFITDMKLKVNEDIFYYPDVFVSCDQNPASEYYREVPVLIVEVISPSTRQTDRREKLRFYQQIPTVQEYILIEQDKIQVEIHRRQENGSWITYFYNDSDLTERIEFQSVGLTTSIEQIYRRVRFETQ